MTDYKFLKYDYPNNFKNGLLAVCNDPLVVKDLQAGENIRGELQDLIEKERLKIDFKALKSEDGSYAFMHAVQARDRIVALEDLHYEFAHNEQTWLIKTKPPVLPLEGRGASQNVSDLRS